MEHICDYEAVFRTVDTKYDSTKTNVIQTTQISVKVSMMRIYSKHHRAGGGLL